MTPEQKFVEAMRQLDVYVRLLVHGEDARDELIKEHRGLIRAACEAWVENDSRRRMFTRDIERRDWIPGEVARILKAVFDD